MNRAKQRQKQRDTEVLRFNVAGPPYFNFSPKRGLRYSNPRTSVVKIKRKREASETVSGLFGQIGGSEFPVEQIAKDRLHVVCATILVIEIIGVLPHIHG